MVSRSNFLETGNLYDVKAGDRIRVKDFTGNVVSGRVDIHWNVMWVSVLGIRVPFGMVLDQFASLAPGVAEIIEHTPMEADEPEWKASPRIVAGGRYFTATGSSGAPWREDGTGSLFTEREVLALGYPESVKVDFTVEVDPAPEEPTDPVVPVEEEPDGTV